MSKNNTNIIWLDCEMTGLDTQRDRIIEIATVVTDINLEVLAEGPAVAIHQPDDVLEAMDDWNQRQHKRSGLYERVQASEYSEADAEALSMNFIKQYVPEKCSPMAGNTICQDRRFLARCMPTLEQYFHYRNLDVTSLKLLAQMWSPAIIPGFKKSMQHLALQDVHDSINELRFYRKHFLHCGATLDDVTA
jgi:oligoribonuclease